MFKVWIRSLTEVSESWEDFKSHQTSVNVLQIVEKWQDEMANDHWGVDRMDSRGMKKKCLHNILC